MAEFGTTTLYLLLVLAAWTGALAVVGARRRSMSTINSARLMLYATAVVSSLSIVILTYAFAVSDFTLSYVHRYSDRTMPAFYKLTAVWGGQEGSLLFWVWLLAVFSAWSVHSNQERLRELLPYVIAVQAALIIFFCTVLLTANPFGTYLVELPTAGRGLNPLLQNFYMVIHPPSLYVGYVGMAIPFAFAIAAVIAGQTDESWIVASRPWALASWYFLTMGLVLGMLWAYEELGWGGFWAWDPVENAGLFPWLTSTAYLHSAMVQERRQMLRVWSVVLAVVTFELTIFGTFLTRSGFVQSVHAFAKSDIGWYFLGFMGLVALICGGLIAWRWRLLRGHSRLSSVLSREFFLLLSNWVLLVAAALVVLLTIFPTLTQVVVGHKITLNAAAFNRWMTPVGLALLALIGFGPLTGWRRSTGSLWVQAAPPALLSVITVVVLVALGVRGLLALLTFGLCTFVTVTVILDLVRGVRVRMRAAGTNVLLALGSVLARSRRHYGGYIVHVGLALMYLGFAGEAFKDEAQLSMRTGQRATVGQYELRFDGIRRHNDQQKEMATATLSIFSAGGQRLGTIQPARWVYFKHPDQPTSEVGIRRSVREDLFVALGGFDKSMNQASFKVIVNPLVNWIWIGFLLISLGAVIAFIPIRARALARSTSES
jgi:cytochrome c-type biogenesis protein CcmF